MRTPAYPLRPPPPGPTHARANRTAGMTWAMSSPGSQVVPTRRRARVAGSGCRDRRGDRGRDGRADSGCEWAVWSLAAARQGLVLIVLAAHLPSLGSDIQPLAAAAGASATAAQPAAETCAAGGNGGCEGRDGDGSAGGGDGAGAGKVALITGISGQDGSYLAEFLIKKGYMVCTLWTPSPSASSSSCGSIRHHRRRRRPRQTNLSLASPSTRPCSHDTRGTRGRRRSMA